MSENAPAIEDRMNGITERLASLDGDFNTNKGFGFQGIMDAQTEKAQADLQIASGQVKEPADKEDSPPEWFGPLNTSLQKMKEDQSNAIGQLANSIAQLKQDERRTPELVYDQFSPEVAPVAQKVDNIQGQISNLTLRTEHQRAKQALNDARGRYKDFDYSDEELGKVWQSFVGKDPNRAANTDWDTYFKVQHETRSNPKLTTENQKLREEIERLKSSRNSVQDLYSVPRSNRQSNTIVKPSDGAEFNEDLYQRAKKKLQRGRFAGFNQALIEEQRKMLTA